MSRNKRERGMAELIGGLMLASVTIIFLFMLMQYFAVRYDYYKAQLSEEQQTSYLYIEDAFLVKEPNGSETLHILIKGKGIIYTIYVNRSLVYVNDTGLNINGVVELRIPVGLNVKTGETIKIVYDGGSSFGTINNEVEGYVGP